MTRKAWANSLRLYERNIIISRKQDSYFSWAQVERVGPPKIRTNKDKKTVTGIVTVFFKSGENEDQEVPLEWTTKDVKEVGWFGNTRVVKVPLTAQEYFDHPTASKELDKLYTRYAKYFRKILGG